MNKRNLIYGVIVVGVIIFAWQAFKGKDKPANIEITEPIPEDLLEELIDSTSKAQIDSALNIEE